jgi:competence protein ComEA
VPAYTRAQLWLLLGLAVLAGAGIAAGNWRRAHVVLAERIERFDTGAPTGGPAPAPVGGLPAGSARAPAAPAEEGPHRTRGAPDGLSVDRRGGALPMREPGQHRHEPPSPSTPVGLRARHPTGELLDLNRATVEELVRLPGVGPALADRILSARAERGRFESVEDLGSVRGFGPVKLARLRDLVTASPPVPSR